MILRSEPLHSLRPCPKRLCLKSLHRLRLISLVYLPYCLRVMRFNLLSICRQTIARVKMEATLIALLDWPRCIRNSCYIHSSWSSNALGLLGSASFLIKFWRLILISFNLESFDHVTNFSQTLAETWSCLEMSSLLCHSNLRVSVVGRIHVTQNRSACANFWIEIKYTTLYHTAAFMQKMYWSNNNIVACIVTWTGFP